MSDETPPNSPSDGAAAVDGGVAEPRDVARTGGGVSVVAIARVAGQTIVGAVLAAGLVGALVFGGLFVGPALGVDAAPLDGLERRPPIIPPSVPQGAREDWAVWTYTDKITRAWGNDWPLVIEWFEELDARYPGNPMVLDKLYVAYLEDGRRLQLAGDLDGARRRYEQAAQFDPDRGVAQERLAELESAQQAPRR